MSRAKYDEVTLNWPEEEAKILLNVIEEEDEDPVDIHDIAPQIMSMFWDAGPHLEEGDDGVEFAEIIYPDKLRVYYQGKRVSLDRAHQALERGLSECIKLGIRTMTEQIAREQHEEASHSQV